MSSDEHGVSQLLAINVHSTTLGVLLPFFGKMDTPAVVPLITG